MKYSMKHAGNKMKHAKKEDKRRRPAAEKKTTPAAKKKIILTASGIIVGVIIIVLIILNFQVIYGFVDSKMSALANMLFSSGGVEEKEAMIEDENIDIEDNATEDLPKDNLPDTSSEKKEDNKDKDNNKDKNDEDKDNTLNSPPTIKLEIYEGPLYSEADDICYYRIKANVTGEPSPEISFSKDDSLGSLGPDKAQVNLKRDSKTYTLTATAENSEGKASDTLTLVWNCNRSPDIKGITLSSDTLYVGKQYEVSVDAVDLDGDELSYNWSVSGGSIIDSTANPTKWNTPDTIGDYNLLVAVSDGKGNTSEASIIAYVGEVVVVEQSPTNLNVPRKESEGGYIEYGYGGVTSNGGNIYAGDSSNNKPCSGFVSFDISELKGGTVQSATLTLRGATVEGDPLSFYSMLNINVLSWGERPIKQDDFKADGIFIAGYTSPDITCNVSKLKDELQKAINEDKSRFQIRIHFSGPYTNNDASADGWRYTQVNVNLNVTAIK